MIRAVSILNSNNPKVGADQWYGITPNPIQLGKNIWSEIQRFERLKKVVKKQRDADKQEKELKKDNKKWRIKYVDSRFEEKKAEHKGDGTNPSTNLQTKKTTT